jgi:dihydroorotate dehydrogenase (fumarate)
MLYGRIQTDFALTGGVHTGQDVVKAMMAGANVAMTASELLANGTERATGILTELREWMVEHEYDSIAQLRGCMSQRAVAEPAAFERANYMKVLGSFNKTIPRLLIWPGAVVSRYFLWEQPHRRSRRNE